MTDATTVFDQSTTPAPVVPTEAVTSEFASDLVGEGKKFKTVADLEKGKLESDTFITQLQGELSQLREDLSQRASIEEALEQLKNTSQSPEDTTRPAVDADQLAKLVAEQVNQLDKAKTQSVNVQTTSDKLASVYGDKAGEILTLKAAELGVSVDFLKSTAETSPQAFFNLIGMNETVQVHTSPTTSGTVNTQALLSNGSSNGKDWAYYETMRRDNPKQYHSAGNAQEMFQAQKDGRFD